MINKSSSNTTNGYLTSSRDSYSNIWTRNSESYEYVTSTNQPRDPLVDTQALGL